MEIIPQLDPEGRVNISLENFEELVRRAARLERIEKAAREVAQISWGMAAVTPSQQNARIDKMDALRAALEDEASA